MEVKRVSILNQAIVEVGIAYKSVNRVSIPFHYIVTFSDTERRVLERAYFCAGLDNYKWWETRYKNIVFSKVRRSIDLNIGGGDNQKRIASMKLL